MIEQARLRLAAAGEAAAIARLSRDAIEHGLAWRWTPRRVAEGIAAADCNVVVATSDSRLAGFGIMRYGDDEAHLLLLAVVPAVRRQGVGSALLRWLEAPARAAGLARVRLEVRRSNPGGREFYAEHGYAELALRRGYYQGLDDAVCMARALHAPN